MHPDILDYHQARTDTDRAICERLADIIGRHPLEQTEPVWMEPLPPRVRRLGGDIWPSEAPGARRLAAAESHLLKITTM